MRKKILAVSLSLVMALAMITGCGDNKGNEQSSASDKTEASDSAVSESSSVESSAGESSSVTEDSSGGEETGQGDENSELNNLIEKAKSASVAEQTYTPVPASAVEESEIFVAPIEGLPDDFIRGVDISSVIAEEQSGVVYKDWDGNEKDIFQILADAGVNYIRVRVWNDPYDADGNGYGGGNCDVEKAAEIGKRAAECGMKLLIDFHYSDFWADPAKQQAPKTWARRTLRQKTELINEFTQESIAKIVAAGADVGMVQIGNEINKGISGTYETEGVMQLLASASAGVRSISATLGKDIKVVIHYTQLDDPEGMMNRVKTLDDYDIDYDIFGVSYYVYWHGTMENMNKVLKDIKAQYGVDTCIMETSYPYTGDDGDMNGNNVNAAEAIEGYPADIQGQAKLVRDIMDYANDAGALGVFYWEPAWTPVGKERETNEVIWEKYGSGWASSYAAAYDTKDAAAYYGGSSWDNQAMFDFDSKAMDSLKVFRWVKFGCSAPLKVMSYADVKLESSLGAAIEMPAAIKAYYNDPSVEKELEVKWDEKDIAKIDVNVGDTYNVNGIVSETGDTVTATVKVMNVNLLKNGTFDEADTSVWQVDDRGDGNSTDFQKKEADATSGETSFHFYSLEAIEFDVYQKVTVTDAGVYEAAANMQGGDVGDSAEIYVYVKAGGQEYRSEPVTLAGWINWQKGKVSDVNVAAGEEIEVGVHVKAAAKGWGTIDDVEFYVKPNVSDAPADNPGENENPGGNETPAADGVFTYYYYYEGSDTLIMNIWDDTNLEFTKDAKLNNAFGWTSPLAELTPVDGKAGWYQTSLKITGAVDKGGLGLYEKSNSNTTIFQMDPQWSDDAGKAVWAEITSGKTGAYAVKDYAITELP